MATKISKALQTAINCLSINDVYLRGSFAECSKDIDPKYSDLLEELPTQQMHMLLKCEVIETDEDVILLRVHIKMGARWVILNSDEEPSDREAIVKSDKSETKVKALIEADYVAEYLMKETLDQKCIDEFAKTNASFHVWPYWRSNSHYD